VKLTELSRASDALVAWVSEVGSGSWLAFRDACATLGLEPAHAARMLGQLGHADFDWHDNRFCAAPTALVAVPGLDGEALLTGARSQTLLAELKAAITEHDIDAEVRPAKRQHGPSTILVECDPASARTLARAAAIGYVTSPDALASALPAVTVEWAGERRSPDARFPHARVSPKTLQAEWDDETSLGRGGLWLVSSHRRFEHYLRRDDGWWYFPTREYGPYLAYPAAGLLSYISAQRILVARLPLPPLHARCAALSSGRLPFRRPVGDDAMEELHVNVSADIALRIASSLGVELPEADH